MQTEISKTIKKTNLREMKPERSFRKVAEEDAQDVILPDKIPDVLRWAREQMDAEDEPLVGMERLNQNQNMRTAYNARTFARRIMTKSNVRILLNGSKYWRGETRLWENICTLSAKLPGKGKGNNIFDAMHRYPSSSLVYHGLKPLFGRYMIIAGEKVQRFALRQNATALFSPKGSEETIAKKWFESNTLPRMQEIVIHMCAISEYILRCAYFRKQAKEEHVKNERKFLSLLKGRIKAGRDFQDREVMRFDPGDPTTELSAESLVPCFEKSLNVAHDAVIEGAKLAIRLYGRKEGSGKQRGKIQLWMLRRPLPEIMDALIQGLENILTELLGNEIDIDEFRLCAMRLLRIIERIYVDVGSVWFSNETDFKIPDDIPRNAEVLVSSDPYTYSFRRYGQGMNCIDVFHHT